MFNFTINKSWSSYRTQGRQNDMTITLVIYFLTLWFFSCITIGIESVYISIIFYFLWYNVICWSSQCTKNITFSHSIVCYLQTRWQSKIEKSGLKLTYGDFGNIMHFSFFTVQYFPPTQKTMIPKVFVS